METTVDPTLLQIARIIHAAVIESGQVAEHDFMEVGLPAALHALKRSELARVEYSNDGEPEHWKFTIFGSSFLQLEVARITPEAALVAIMPMGEFVFDYSIAGMATDLTLLNAYERIIPETTSLWRGIGLIILALVEKCLVFEAHEERGAWILRITKRGQKMGMGKRNELFYYSATAEVPRKNMEVVRVAEFSQCEGRSTMKLN